YTTLFRSWLTIAPELYAVWKQQAQLVSDIAGAYGKRQLLTREQMLYCLFSHTAAGAFRSLVIRVGERYVIRRAPLSALYAIANKIALRIAQRSAGRIVTRWVPALGALGVAGYVYYDTGKVADSSIELFSRDVKIEGELEVEGANALADAGDAAPRRRSRTPPAGKTTRAGQGKAAAKAGKGRAATKKAPARKTAAKKAASRKPAPSRSARGSGRTRPAAP